MAWRRVMCIGCVWFVWCTVYVFSGGEVDGGCHYHCCYGYCCCLVCSVFPALAMTTMRSFTVSSCSVAYLCSCYAFDVLRVPTSSSSCKAVLWI